MTDEARGEATLTIDDSKVTILRRATRLCAWNVQYLTSMRDTARNALPTANEIQRGILLEDIARLEEILTWLNEMET